MTLPSTIDSRNRTDLAGPLSFHSILLVIVYFHPFRKCHFIVFISAALSPRQDADSRNNSARNSSEPTTLKCFTDTCFHHRSINICGTKRILYLPHPPTAPSRGARHRILGRKRTVNHRQTLVLKSVLGGPTVSMQFCTSRTDSAFAVLVGLCTLSN